jgi:flavin-dependent dehydrogenase
MKPITIAGSGPSGLTAAINLAKAGYTVEVCERNSDCGQRFFGDLEGLENWSKKEDVLEELQRMNVAINFDCAPFFAVTVTNGATHHQFRFRTPLFYAVKRGPAAESLDRGLKRQALHYGVVMKFNTTLPIERADIVATGPIAKELFAVDKGMIFQTTMKDIAIGLINDDAALRGYAYLMVTNGYGCLCTVLFNEFTAIHRCFEEAKRIFSSIVPLNIQNPKMVGGSGGFSLKNLYKVENRLYVGEAAGVQDFLWGFGIRDAIASGYLAARSIIDGKDYPQLAQKYFGRKLKASLVNRFLWEKFIRRGYSFVMERVKNVEYGLGFLHRIHSFSLVQRVLYPFALASMRRRYKHLRL